MDANEHLRAILLKAKAVNDKVDELDLPGKNYNRPSSKNKEYSINESIDLSPISPYDGIGSALDLDDNFIASINPNHIVESQEKEIPYDNMLSKSLSKYTNTVSKKMANSGTMLTESQIRKIVREEMESIVDDYFDKRVIKEDIQLKVGNTIFSGKISPLPAKKKR